MDEPKDSSVIRTLSSRFIKNGSFPRAQSIALLVGESNRWLRRPAGGDSTRHRQSTGSRPGGLGSGSQELALFLSQSVGVDNNHVACVRDATQ